MTINDLAECAGKAYPRAFTQKNIQSGFSVSGIFPFNQNVFLSSYVTDRPVAEEPASKLNLFKTSISPGTSALVPNVYQHRTPEEIRPFPKAVARHEKKTGTVEL